MSFTTEDCDLAFIKQDQYRVTLASETKQIDTRKLGFAAQNLLLKSIRDVVESQAFDRLIKGMQLETWYKDETVISKGDRGYKLYFVAEGHVSCFEREDGPTSTLGVNSYFGERALLSSNKLRTMNVKALSDCSLYSLSAGTIEDILSQEFEKVL